MNKKYVALFAVMFLSVGTSFTADVRWLVESRLASLQYELKKKEQELQEKKGAYAPLLYKLGSIFLSVPAFVGAVSGAAGAVATSASIGHSISTGDKHVLAEGFPYYYKTLKELYPQILSGSVSLEDIAFSKPKTELWALIEGTSDSLEQKIVTRLGLAAPLLLTGSFVLWSVHRYLLSKVKGYKKEIDTLEKDIENLKNQIAPSEGTVN